MKAGPGVTAERMVKLAGGSRAGFYRFDDNPKPVPDRDMDLRDAIQQIALEWPSYGRPRITAELRRRDWKVNPKLVYRILREDNMLCVRKRKFIVTTTDSSHGRKIYPNRAGTMVLTDVDQLWVADITYIRLSEEFVFLAVIFDACSRRVIGWVLDRTLENKLTLERSKWRFHDELFNQGWSIHPDRGTQYVSDDYTNRLKQSGIEIEKETERNSFGLLPRSPGKVLLWKRWNGGRHLGATRIECGHVRGLPYLECKRPVEAVLTQ